MKLAIKKGSENYTCNVVQISEIFDIDGADRVKRVNVLGNNVVVGLDTRVGDKMLYFCSGTKLNRDYCTQNNLLTDEALNKNKVKGYISHKQFRVKAIKLRSVISDGILLSVSSLEFVYPQINLILNVGDTFTNIGDFSLCEKYFVPVRNGNPGGSAPIRSRKISRLLDNQFHLHNDTENLRRNMNRLELDDMIGIHYKKHGTSVVIANIQVKRNLNWYERLLKRFVPINETEYDIIYSSRNVVKNAYLNTNPNSYYPEDIWGVVAEEIGHLIPKNYTLYGEILGYLPSGGMIQKDYAYGCDVGGHKFYVYRVTVVNPEGIVVELTDLQIKEFCDSRGLLYSDTLLYYGTVKDYILKQNYPTTISSLPEDCHIWREDMLTHLEKTFTEKDCYMCTNKIPEEGIVLRKELLSHYEAYKLKSHRFILKESDNQENEVPDIESQIN